MEQEKSFETSLVDEMKIIIKDTRESIGKKLNQGLNPWLMCFVDEMEALDTKLMLARDRQELEEDEFNILDNKIENLKTKVWNLRQEYPDFEQQPSDEIKDELIKQLNIFE